MRIKIKTDYHDLYDHWFDREADCTFLRHAVSSWCHTRDDMFRAFATIGLATPKYGAVTEFRDDESLVVYLDQSSHCGEGKILVSAKNARLLGLSHLLSLQENGISSVTDEVAKKILAMNPLPSSSHTDPAPRCDMKASAYIPDAVGVSYRFLSCGGYSCWFRHESFADWRSNVGDGDLFVVTEGECIFPTGFRERVLNPVWAIDFVLKRTDRGNALLAVDFNTAPRVRGTPLAKLYTPKEMALGIVDQITRLQSEDLFNGNLFDNNMLLLR